MIESLLKDIHPILAANPGTALLAAFGAGLFSCLLPCIYPLIPITLAVFGALSAPSRRAAFLLSLTYVSGMALTFATLGVLSAKTGAIFGAYLGNPFVVAILAVFFLLLALLTLDVIEVPGLYRIQSSAGRIGGKGVSGAFLMGTASGLVAAPCTGPVLAVLLGVATLSQHGPWGFTLLLAYALGLGLPFVVLGTFSNLLEKLPRGGRWFSLVKMVLAGALVTIVLFFLYPFFKSSFAFVLTILNRPQAILLTAIVAIALYYGTTRPGKLTLLFGAGTVGLAAYFALHAFSPSLFRPPSLLESRSAWEGDLEQALVAARKEKRLIFVDIFADWCTSCHELERNTFRDPKVVEALSAMKLVRIDATLPNVQSETITKSYKVSGLPTLLFLLPSGAEIPDSRISGFIESEILLEHIHKVKDAADF